MISNRCKFFVFFFYFLKKKAYFHLLNYNLIFKFPYLYNLFLLFGIESQITFSFPLKSSVLS